MTNANFLTTWNSLLSKITSSQSKYKKISTFGAAAFLLMLVGVSQITQSKSDSQANQLSFKKAFDQWILKPSIDEQALKNLTTHLKKIPDLVPLYQWKIIQHCLNLGDIQGARVLLKESGFFKPSVDNIYFHRFSEVSLLITSKEYTRAYEESLLLKEDLLTDRIFWEHQHYAKYGSDLFAYNLVRIAFLSKLLNKKELELTAWSEVKKYTGLEKNLSTPAFLDIDTCRKLLDSFSEEGISLKDYITFRESFLRKAL